MKKDIVKVGKSGFKPAKEKMLMEASGNQKEHMFTYAQIILLQLCLISVFININIIPDLGAGTAICFFQRRSRQMVQVRLSTLLMTLDKSAIFTVIPKDNRHV